MPDSAWRAAVRTLAVACCLLIARAASAQTYTFHVFAGQVNTLGGTDGTGTAATFSLPDAVATDAAGNIYVADYFDHTVRKITPAGVVTTLAGLSGAMGSTDGTGSAARFKYPTAITVESGGANIFVADTSNHTIRQVTSLGVVTTLAGSAGVIGSADGTGSAARFNFPYGISIDGSNNLYVGDSNNHTIRKVTPGGVVTTIAGLATVPGSADGTGSAARFSYPGGVTADGSGNVFVCDTNNQTIRKIAPGAVVTTLAGSPTMTGSVDGAGSVARFNGPYSGAFDTNGNLFIADRYTHLIRKISPSGMVTTIGGLAGSDGSADGRGHVARFNNPTGIAVDSLHHIYVADSSNEVIRIGIPMTRGDFQGDLKSDIFWRNGATGFDSQWLMDGPNVAVSSSMPTVGDPNFKVAGIGDFQGDGKTDLLWRNSSTGANVIWLMDGTSVAVSALLPTVPDPNWTVAGVGDFQGDGKADILWRNVSTGDDAVWIMDGAAIAVGASLPSVTTDWKIVGIGDFQGDGKDDLLWRNSSTGDDVIWMMDGTTVGAGPMLPTVGSSNWTVAGVGDFQGDGKADIVWRNIATGDNSMWLMDGPAVVVSAAIPSVADTNWKVARVADFQGDGKADIVWRNSSSGANSIWLMDGTTPAVTASLPTVSDVNWQVAGPP